MEFNGLRLLNVYPETIADGWGLRYAIYLAGCSHGCPGCHNVESWNPQKGVALTSSLLWTIISEIKANPLLDGITLSGGDPFFNPLGLAVLLEQLKLATGLNIWCYTGYTYKQLVVMPQAISCLKLIDVLVDGRFEKHLFDPTLSFRGSSNQQILVLEHGRIKD
ncbi:MAG: anaerobic ribonucleoside-triphosphate reductase activating protein [Culicoidibacterales bacterium]